ncbi:MAG: GFA family protein [Alphaproteobacteria bacterium]
MANKLKGNCRCGDVQYMAAGKSVLVEYCHCESCRRAVGAPLIAWAAFRRDEFDVTAGNPAAYESSPGVVRTFCGRCGTSLTLTDKRFPDEVYVTLASLNDPEVLPPEFHIWRSQRLSWLETSDKLPRYVQFKADGRIEE